MKHSYRKLSAALSVLVLTFMLQVGLLSANESPLMMQVRQNLTMLPYYSLFDYLAFELDGSDVRLTGQVYRATLKKDAEIAVKSIPGIDSVKNDIEILPVSYTDDRIRVDTYHAIYYHPEFQRYAIQAVPPIHILVKNGDVTLYGSVATELDKNLAALRAESVAGVFSVTNKLKVNL